MKILKKGKINHNKIKCLECDSIIQYDNEDVKNDGYKYFFGNNINIKLLYIDCLNCHKPIFLDGKTRIKL